MSLVIYLLVPPETIVVEIRLSSVSCITLLDLCFATEYTDVHKTYFMLQFFLEILIYLKN